MLVDVHVHDCRVVEEVKLFGEVGLVQGCVGGDGSGQGVGKHEVRAGRALWGANLASPSHALHAFQALGSQPRSTVGRPGRAHRRLSSPDTVTVSPGSPSDTVAVTVSPSPPPDPDADSTPDTVTVNLSPFLGS